MSLALILLALLFSSHATMGLPMYPGGSSNDASESFSSFSQKPLLEFRPPARLGELVDKEGDHGKRKINDLSKQSKLLIKEHERLIGTGQKLFQSIGEKKVKSLDEAIKLVEQGTPPNTLYFNRVGGIANNAAYTATVEDLKKDTSGAEGHLQRAQLNLDAMKSSRISDHYQEEAQHVSTAMDLVHKWTTEHPHDSTEPQHFNLRYPTEVAKSTKKQLVAEREGVKTALKNLPFTNINSNKKWLPW